jgi:hypothetical protein
VNEQVFHFRIEASDANTGQGTVLVGIIKGTNRPGLLPVDLREQSSVAASSSLTT